MDTPGTPRYLRESALLCRMAEACLAATTLGSVDSKPSRRAVRRTQASSGEWPAAPDARPESLDLFVGHHGIDPLDPSGRPGEEAIGPVAHASPVHAGAVVSLSNGAAAETRPPPVSLLARVSGSRSVPLRMLDPERKRPSKNPYFLAPPLDGRDGIAGEERRSGRSLSVLISCSASTDCSVPMMASVRATWRRTSAVRVRRGGDQRGSCSLLPQRANPSAAAWATIALPSDNPAAITPATCLRDAATGYIFASDRIAPTRSPDPLGDT